MSNFWKNKKIILYVALQHHTRFLMPIAATLTRMGAKIMYVVGQAERSQEITAVECKLDYRHVFEYLEKEDIAAIQQNYSLVRETFNEGLSKDFALGSQMVTVMDKTLYSTAMEYIGFKKLIQTESPDLCLALHEVNRWGKIFAFRARESNVPFITLQEGLNYGLDFHHIGHVQYATLDLVWGDRVRKMLADYEAPGDRIIPVGNTHISEELNYQKTQDIRNKKRHQFKCENKFAVLLLLSSRLPKSEVLAPIIQTVAQSKDIALIIKFHPATRKSQQDNFINTIPEKEIHHIHFIHTEESTYDLISLCDLSVLAQPSTTGLESLAFGKPLVQLEIEIKDEIRYSFIEKGVAQGMTPEELAQALKSNTNFSDIIPQNAVDAYLASELHDIHQVSDRMIDIFKQVIQANQYSDVPIQGEAPPPEVEWTIMLPVCESPDLFLSQLEAISLNSESGSSYEVVLIEPQNISEEIKVILASLEGNVKRRVIGDGDSIWEAANQAALESSGHNLIFIDKHIVPQPYWLKHLEKAMKSNRGARLFGGKITTPYKNIVHAGIVLNVNHMPVSAYVHLDEKFPAANKQRAFQMVDHCIAIERGLFLRMGGFWSATGRYAILDLCLKAADFLNSNDAVLYVPTCHMVRQTPAQEKDIPGHAIHFYARWHGVLMESEDHLYEKDGVSKLQLDAARMTRAVETATLI